MSERVNQSRSTDSGHPLAAIILAAGKGTRMNSDLPKVVHKVAGRPMVRWVVDAVREAGASPIVLVVGHGADAVREIFTGDDADLRFAIQEPQLGTGHAVQQAQQFFVNTTDDTDIFVLCGDGPLIRAETLRTLLETHRGADAAATLASAVIDDPAGYGRIVRDENGRFTRIVEHKDATEVELKVREINPSYYCFRARPLFELLDQVGNDNAKGEYYLTDVLPLMLRKGHSVEVVDAVPPDDVLSINTPEQLTEVGSILEARSKSRRSAAMEQKR